MAQYLRIGEVSKLTGINPKTLQYYEEIGVIPRPKRSHVLHGNGYRLYTYEDVQRLEFIKGAKVLDLSLAEIKDLVAGAQRGCCSSVNPKLAHLVEQKLGEIGRRIADLEKLRKVLKRLKQLSGETLVQPESQNQVRPIIVLPCQADSCSNTTQKGKKKD